MDPAQEKANQYGQQPMYVNPIAAQPVQSSAYGTVAAPIQPGQAVVFASVQQGGYPVNNVVGGNPLYPSNGRPYPRNRWGDSICSWPENLFPSCYCVCCVCCGMYLAAQISQKVGYSSFQSVITAFVCFCIFGFILQLIIGGLWVVWIPMIFAFCFALGLRLHITNKENITECGTNPCLGEFCVGFWCWYCSVAQMARHVYGYTKALDGDSDPFRPDQYSGVQNV